MPPWLQQKPSALQLGCAGSDGGCLSQPWCLARLGITLCCSLMERVAACAFLLSHGMRFDSCSCPFSLALRQRCISMPAIL